MLLALGYSKHWLKVKKVVNPLSNKPCFLRVYRTSLFENTVRKGEIARNEKCLLFPQTFLPVWRAFCDLYQSLKLLSANSIILEESKICRLGKGQWSILVYMYTPKVTYV